MAQLKLSDLSDEQIDKLHRRIYPPPKQEPLSKAEEGKFKEYKEAHSGGTDVDALISQANECKTP